MKEIAFKTKNELDILSYDEVVVYRDLFLENFSKNSNGSAKQYFNELEFYLDYRFSDKKFETFNRWVKEYSEDSRKYQDSKLIVGLLLKPNGFEMMYYTDINYQLQKIGTFYYIKNICIDVPHEYKNMSFNF